MSSTTIMRSARRATASITPRSAVASTSRAGALQTRYSSTVHDNDPDVLENEKEKNLSGKQLKSSAWFEEAPGWNEYLATASEADVKADRADTHEGPEVLQRKTVEHLLERHHADDATEGRTVEAQYERDEVEGPLKNALGTIKETVEETIEETVETVKTGRVRKV